MSVAAPASSSNVITIHLNNDYVFFWMLSDDAVDMDSILSTAGDYVAEALDAAAMKQGINLSDASIYRAHAAKFEVRSPLGHPQFEVPGG
jgi:hypothetical protein